MKKLLAVLIIFIFSMSLRLWNINSMGRTWDEAVYVEVGYKFIQLIKQGDITNGFFYKWSDEPPLARYIYGIFGGYDVQSYSNGQAVFNYDYTFAHIASVLISSLAIVSVVLLGIEFISLSVGIIAGVILAMLPLFLGFSQTSTLESVQFFTFTISVYSFLRFLKTRTYKRAVVAGFFLGLAFLSKYTNILTVPLFFCILWLWQKFSIHKIPLRLYLKQILTIFIASIITFFSFWPMPLFNPLAYILSNYELRSGLAQYPSIEVFFGKLIHLPIFYYLVFFLITTPIIIIFLFLLGAKYISDYGISFEKLKQSKKSSDLKWLFYSLIVWFCLPFIQSFYNFRHQGVRFIIEIYAPLSIVAAIGLDYVFGRLPGKLIYKAILFLGIILYLLTILISLTPYYLDYFNEVVGGTKTVYEKGLFQIGWWGQGLRETGHYLQNNAKKNSKIGLFISPPHVFPSIKNQKLIFIDPNKGVYNPKIKYDYVVVNYFHILREGFDDSGIKRDYNLVYEVKADGGVLVYIYEKK